MRPMAQMGQGFRAGVAERAHRVQAAQLDQLALVASAGLRRQSAEMTGSTGSGFLGVGARLVRLGRRAARVQQDRGENAGLLFPFKVIPAIPDCGSLVGAERLAPLDRPAAQVRSEHAASAGRQYPFRAAMAMPELGFRADAGARVRPVQLALVASAV